MANPKAKTLQERFGFVDHNTLALAVWTQTCTERSERNQRSYSSSFARSALLGTLSTVSGPQRVAEDADVDSVALLLRCLQDLRHVRARHLRIYTNDALLTDLYTMPICLEPRRPGHENFADERQWQILYRFCDYETWRVAAHETLPNAQKLWKELCSEKAALY